MKEKAPKPIKADSEEKSSEGKKGVSAEGALAIAVGVGVIATGVKKLYDKFKHRHDKEQVA